MSDLFQLASRRSALYGDAVRYLTVLFYQHLDAIADDPHAVFPLEDGGVAAGVAEVERIGKSLGVDAWDYWAHNATPFELKRLQELTR
jgi:hypothetical protein